MRSRFRAFIRGAASVLDLMPAPRVAVFGRDILARSDAEALAADWRAVGDDLYRAMGQVRDEIEAEHGAAADPTPARR